MKENKSNQRVVHLHDPIIIEMVESKASQERKKLYQVVEEMLRYHTEREKPTCVFAVVKGKETKAVYAEFAPALRHKELLNELQAIEHSEDRQPYIVEKLEIK